MGNVMKNTKGRTFISPQKNLDGYFFCFLLADTNLFLLAKAKHALCLKKEKKQKNCCFVCFFGLKWFSTYHINILFQLLSLLFYEFMFSKIQNSIGEVGEVFFST